MKGTEKISIGKKIDDSLGICFFSIIFVNQKEVIFENG